MRYKILILFALLAFTVSAENLGKIIYDSYVNKDMAMWKTVIDSLQKQKELGKFSTEQKWQLLDYQYGYLGWAVSEKKTMRKEAEKYLSVAKENLSELIDEFGKTSSSNAFNASGLWFSFPNSTNSSKVG